MSEEEFINKVEGHITSLKNLDNKALKILVSKLEEENKSLKEVNKKLWEWVDKLTKDTFWVAEENKKLKEENQYRESIADVLPEWEGHIAEETIQDLQKRIDELAWFEKEYHRSRDRIKKLEWVLEHEYGRKIPY